MFLDAIGLVEYEDEISSLDKLEWGFAERSFLSELFVEVNIWNGELCTATRGRTFRIIESAVFNRHSSPYNITVSTNKLYCFQTFGKQNRYFKQNGLLTFPGFTMMSKATLSCVSLAPNGMKIWICALLERKKGFSFRTDFPTGRRFWYDSRNINFLSVTSWPRSFK